ncbi:MAG: AAA family ATPase [Chloroflexi bacterium]|nr:AAA family ATPase [Chloroflexota bacterium]
MTGMNITTTMDTFSNRASESPDSLVDDIQFHVCCEELVRRHFGKVHEWSNTFSPTGDLLQSEGMERLEEALAELGDAQRARTVLDGFSRAVIFTGQDWVARVHIGHHWDMGDPADGDTAFDPPMKSVFLTLVACDEALHAKLLTTLAARGFRPERTRGRDDTTPMYLAVPDERRGVMVTQHDTPIVAFDQIAGNYTPEVVSKVQALLKQGLKDAKHGIVIISGPPGTGKSHLVHSLLSEVKRNAVVCNPASTFLREARYLNRVTERFRRSLIVLEDVGEYLSEDNVSAHPDTAATLLNYSDGLLSIVADCLFILTFNADIGRISRAVTRPGRCLAHIHVGHLPHGHAQGLAGFPIPQRNYTLAEVYEMRRTGEVPPEPQKERAGFRTR